jgi:hypothetical protein
VAGDVDSIKAKSVRGGVNGEVVHVAKGQIGVECRGVSAERRGVKRET